LDNTIVTDNEEEVYEEEHWNISLKSEAKVEDEIRLSEVKVS